MHILWIIFQLYFLQLYCVFDENRPFRSSDNNQNPSTIKINRFLCFWNQKSVPPSTLIFTLPSNSSNNNNTTNNEIQIEQRPATEREVCIFDLPPSYDEIMRTPRVAQTKC